MKYFDLSLPRAISEKEKDLQCTVGSYFVLPSRIILEQYL